MNLALIGMESLRGKEIKSVLNEKKFSIGKIEFFDPDVEEEYSKLTQFRDEPKVVNALDENALSDIDLVFLAADKQINRRYGRLAADQNFFAIDLSETFVGEKDVPKVVAGINDHLVLKNKPRIVANPHPAAIMLSHLFDVIRKQTKFRKAIVFVLQPASAFDEPGIEELANQSLGMLQSASVSKKVFKAQIAFNMLSQIQAVDRCGFSDVERQIVAEVGEVLADPNLPLSLSMVQAPVFHAYSLMCYLELDKEMKLEDLAELFKRSSSFKMMPDSISCPVSSVAVAGKEKIFVGQLKKDETIAESFWLWAAADNLTVGSALNAFEIAKGLTAII